MEDFGLEELLKDQSEKLDNKGRSSSAMDQETCAKVVEEVQAKVGLDSKPKTMAAISGVCQRGGINRSASAVTASYTIDGKEVTSFYFYLFLFLIDSF